MNHFRTILAPIDFSECTRGVVERAADLSRRYEAPLLLLHAYEPPSYVLPEGLVTLERSELERILANLKQSLEKVADAAREAGAVQVEAQVVQGHAVLEIIRIARERSDTLIVMGTHGRTGLKHLLIGSVAENVVRTAPCPVVTVRGPGVSAR